MEETDISCIVCKEKLTVEDLHIVIGKERNECVCDSCLRDYDYHELK